MTPVEPTADAVVPAAPRSFRVWVRTVVRPSFAAILASLIGTSVIAMILALAQATINSRANGGSAALGPWRVDLPDQTALLLCLAAVLLTLASVIQSLLRRFDAGIVRRRLRQVIAEAAGTDRLHQRELLAERFLLEGWTGWVSATVQALGYSAILAVAGGAVEVIGLVVAMGIAALVALRFFSRATDASRSFFIAQAAARDLDKRRHRRGDEPSEAEVVDVMTDISEAVFRRDTEVFRMPAGANAILSLGILTAAVLPALFTLDDAALPLFLVTLIIWRQRVMDAVGSVGPLAWTMTMWKDAGATTSLAADDI